MAERIVVDFKHGEVRREAERGHHWFKRFRVRRLEWVIPI